MDGVLQDVVHALKALGYKSTEAKMMAKSAILELGEDAPMSTLVKEALKNPSTLPRRHRGGREPGFQPLNASELALQDRLKSDRDRIAQQLNLDPTLIANRSQLAQIARDPERLDGILLPWQADLLRNEPALKNGDNGPE